MSTTPIGIVRGLSTLSTTAAATKGTLCASVTTVHSLPVRRSLPSVIRGRHQTLASSGSAASGAAPAVAVADVLAPGDRAAQNHHGSVERQLPNLLGPALALRDDSEIALVELLAEGANRRLHAGRILCRPLGHRRVPGLVHADES